MPVSVSRHWHFFKRAHLEPKLQINTLKTNAGGTMKFIKEFRTMSKEDYIYDFEISGTCGSNDPSSFNLIATSNGHIPIYETEFFEFWKFAVQSELEVEITTKFRYVKMKQWETGAFILLIYDVPASDASTIKLRFGDYISRNY